MTPPETLALMVRHVRDAVRPHLGAYHSRAVSGTAHSGDATFAIDDIAEDAIVQFIEQRKLSLALYSEDKGLVEFGTSPEGVLIVDPIDGTRPAVAGFEACVVSAAWADYTAHPTMADVCYGALAELKGDALFTATRGGGAEWLDAHGERLPLRLLPITEMASAPLSFECVGRPLEMLGVVLGDIVDTAATRGGCFLFNSTAFSLSRLLTGQLAAVLDVGARILQQVPGVRPRFVELGKGKPLGLFTYDIAAAALIAQEAGAVVTNAYGASFDKIPLLDTSEANLQTIVAASTPALHAALLEKINAGVERLSVERTHTQ